MSGNFLKRFSSLTSFSPLDDDVKIGNNEKPPGHRSPFSALFLSLPFCGENAVLRVYTWWYRYEDCRRRRRQKREEGGGIGGGGGVCECVEGGGGCLPPS